MWPLFRAALAALLAAACTVAAAAPAQVENFDMQTWQSWQTSLARPAAVVFSTTDCSHCPAAITAIAQELKKRRAHIPLIVVVMDGADAPGLLQEPHFASASRLFVFDGRTAALHYSVNPDWRGITPYVALFGRTGATQLILGKPSAAELGGWLGQSK